MKKTEKQKARKKRSATKKSAPRRNTAKAVAKNVGKCVGKNAQAMERFPDSDDMVENAVHGILIHDNFRPLYVNASFASLFGFENVADVLALPLLRPLIPTDNWPFLEESYGELIHGKREATTFQLRAIRADGSELWVSVTERVLALGGCKAVQWSVLDISSRMALEQTLVEREQRLQAMLEILPTPVYIERRSDGKILFVNRKTCLLLQQSAGPLLKRKSIDFFQNDDDWKQLRVILKASPDVRELEFPMKTAQERTFTAEIAAIAIDYAGASAVIVALNDVSQRKQLEAELFHQASTDALTGISNRRYFMTQAENDFRRASRYQRKLTIMMLDVDHFKQVNDRYGHAAGDIILQAIIATGVNCLRESDVIGRLGGEEFAVLLHETEMNSALEVAERLRQSIEKLEVPVGTVVLRCSVSIGIAQLSERDQNVDELLHRADQAMYQAKDAGRNRVVVAMEG